MIRMDGTGWIRHEKTLRHVGVDQENLNHLEN